ncbi:MAG: V-type ATP synthase subunit D [Candidatus Bipolaricaulota bacterium]|nr:V-type ATP synthase subunit D [Candidatus Bipolaricaulota bacterium]MDW8030449.1 V-type ATP synthase subunit D [Candidatus Bipolaricaulota bacterium]
MEAIKATRDELVRVRQELAIAQSGKQILEKKKEALLTRFLAMVRQYKGRREALLAELNHLKDLLALTRARDGSITLKSLALATSQDITLEITRDNVMGTRIFHAKHPDVTRDILSRGYNPASTSSRIEACAEVAERLLDQMLDIAHLEHNIKTVGREMRSLTSKINALEEIIIPGLQAKKRYIEELLEQNEREEIFRLKMVKRIRENKQNPRSTPTAQQA